LEKFFKQELQERKSYQYPPYGELIKLFFQHHDPSVCQREATSLYDKLQNLKIFDSGAISKPYLHQRQQIRGRYRIQILAKIKQKNNKEWEHLKVNIPDYWMIDRDPLSVL
jgi:primosomal protein N'